MIELIKKSSLERGVKRRSRNICKIYRSFEDKNREIFLITEY